MPIPAPIHQTIVSQAMAHLARQGEGARQGTNLHLFPNPFTRGTELLLGLNRTTRLDRDSVLVQPDKAPHLNWSHPCELLRFDLSQGTLIEILTPAFPPLDFFLHPDQLEDLHVPVRRRRSPLRLAHPGRLPMLEQALTRPVGQRHALLFSAFTEYRHLNDLEFLYRTLIDRYGFEPANILCLNLDGSLRALGCQGSAGLWPGDDTPYRLRVDGPGSKAELMRALDALGRRLRAEDLLLIHTNNHGGGPPEDPESWIPGFMDFAPFTATDMAQALRALPTFNSLIVMMEQCHSGGFLRPIIDHSPARSTSFSAACAEEASSWGDYDFDPFARDWTAAVQLRGPDGTDLGIDLPFPVSMRHAFDYAHAVGWVGDLPVHADRPQGFSRHMNLAAPCPLAFRSGDHTLVPIGAPGQPLDLFLVSTTGTVWQVRQGASHASSWEGPFPLGGRMTRLAGLPDDQGQRVLFGITAHGEAHCALLSAAPTHDELAWSPMDRHARQIEAIRQSDGRIALFLLGEDQILCHTTQTRPGVLLWEPWNRMGNGVREFQVILAPDGHLEAYAIGADDAIHHTRQMETSGATWHPWRRLGGAMESLQVAVNGEGRREVFGIGTDKALWHTRQLGSAEAAWSPWESLGGIVRGLATVTTEAGRIEVFAIGANQSVWHKWQLQPAGPTWSSWTSRGGDMKSVVATRRTTGGLQLCGVGTDDALHTCWQADSPDGPWTAWQRLTGHEPSPSQDWRQPIPQHSMESLFEVCKK